MQLKVTSEFIDKITASYGAKFIGGYAYSANVFLPILVKTYIVLASADELIVVSLGSTSGEPKGDIRYPYTELALTLKNSPLAKIAIIQPPSSKRLKLTIPKKTIGITEYQERLIALLENKTK